jgi:Flp pilus assembly protein TadG
MLEFAMVIPFMLFILAFSIDMGRMVFAANAAQQAVSQAARQSAVFGAAGIDGTIASTTGETRAAVVSSCNATPSQCKMALYAMNTALAETPGGRMLENWALTVSDDPANKLGRVCTASAPSVRVKLSYDINWLTPGMYSLLGIVGGSGDDAPLEKQSLATSATARCEVEIEVP